VNTSPNSKDNYFTPQALTRCYWWLLPSLTNSVCWSHPCKQSPYWKPRRRIKPRKSWHSHRNTRGNNSHDKYINKLYELCSIRLRMTQKGSNLSAGHCNAPLDCQVIMEYHKLWPILHLTWIQYTTWIHGKSWKTNRIDTHEYISLCVHVRMCAWELHMRTWTCMMINSNRLRYHIVRKYQQE